MIINRLKDEGNGQIFGWIRTHNLPDISLCSVVLFTGSWLLFGNTWSLIFSIKHVKISSHIVLIFSLIYLATVIPTILSFFSELLRIKSRLKWIIISEALVFTAFIITPPRNADAMRVWLAKVYDVWMNGEKIVRPYWHYNTPDAFTLFHLPLINLWDGQIFQLSIWVALCALIIMMIKIGSMYQAERGVLIGIILLLFNPLVILASTAVITDIPIMLAVAGLLYSMILYEQGRFGGSMVLVFLFTAFGMNIKYNMLLFLPAIFYWSFVKTWNDGICWKTSPIAFLLILLSLLPYLMNYVNIGNPVWPALVKYFPSHTPYWDEVALKTSTGFLESGRTLFSFIHSFFRLFLIPHHINPLAFLPIIFIFRKFKYLGYTPALMVATYIFFLWLMIPQFSVDEKERYVLYLFPIIIPLGISSIYYIASTLKTGDKLKKCFEGAVFVTVITYGIFTVVYSYDAFRYIVTLDKGRWHRATWYYNEYSWMNKNIKLDGSGQVLVVVSCQQTYYLKLPYVNGDNLSALINWKKMTELKKVMKELNKYNIQYIFVDDDFLKTQEDTERAINILKSNNRIMPILDAKTDRYASRLFNTKVESRVILYKVKQG